MVIIKKGDKYNRLTAIRFDHKKGTDQHWLFKCNCGNEKVIRVISVKKNHTQSCGCLQEEVITTHGMTNTRIYKSWAQMKARCLNKNNPAYKDYGGRGITICPEWMKFENFYEDMGDMPEGKTLGRIKNNGNYCKSNSKWSTPKEQANNTRQNHLLYFKGKTQTIAQWSEEVEIPYHTLWMRIFYGWTVEEALTESISRY